MSSKKKKKPKANKAQEKKPSKRTISGKAVASRSGGQRASSSGPVKNIASMAQFEREVLGAEKPVLVDFWAPWCGPCHAMAPIFEAAAEVYQEDVMFAKVNTESVPSVAEAMGIRSLPTLLAFWEGEVADIKVGVTPEHGMERLVKRLKKKAAKAQGLEEEEGGSLLQRVKGWFGG